MEKILLLSILFTLIFSVPIFGQTEKEMRKYQKGLDLLSYNNSSKNSKHNARKRKKGLEIIQELWEKYPKNEEFNYTWGKISFKYSLFVQSIDCLNKAKRIPKLKKEVSVYQTLVCAYFKLGKFEKIIETCEEGKKYHPQLEKSFNSLIGISHQMLDNTLEAFKIYNQTTVKIKMLEIDFSQIYLENYAQVFLNYYVDSGGDAKPLENFSNEYLMLISSNKRELIINALREYYFSSCNIKKYPSYYGFNIDDNSWGYLTLDYGHQKGRATAIVVTDKQVKKFPEYYEFTHASASRGLNREMNNGSRQRGSYKYQDQYIQVSDLTMSKKKSYPNDLKSMSLQCIDSTLFFGQKPLISFPVGSNKVRCVFGKCIDGYGVCILKNGVIYEGYFDNDGLMTKYGRMEWRTGDYYVGEYRKGLRHGNGVYMHARTEWESLSSSTSNVKRGRWEGGEFKGVIEPSAMANFLNNAFTTINEATDGAWNDAIKSIIEENNSVTSSKPYRIVKGDEYCNVRKSDISDYDFVNVYVIDGGLFSSNVKKGSYIVKYSSGTSSSTVSDPFNDSSYDAKISLKAPATVDIYYVPAGKSTGRSIQVEILQNGNYDINLSSY